MEEGIEARPVGGSDFGIGGRYVSRKIKAEHAAHAVAGERDTGLFGRSHHAVDEPGGPGRQRIVKARLLDQPQRGQTGCHRHRIARQGAGLVDAAQRGNAVHDVGPAAKGADRHATADHLAQRGQVRLDAVQRLRTAQCHAETGHHFVVDQHAAVLLRQGTQGLHEGGRRTDQVHVAGYRLQNDAGDALADFGKRALQLLDVVVLQHQRMTGEVFRHAGRARVAERQQAGAGLDQQAVGMAVIAAFKLDDGIATGKAARQPDGAHGGFGAG